MKTPLKWIVKVEDWNGRCIRDYNIIGEFLLTFIKKEKKLCPDKESFAKEMRSEMAYHFWGKCEWETTIHLIDDRIVLRPWPESKFRQFELDVTDDTTFGWKGFAQHHIKRQSGRNEAKIDVYDQVMWRWDEFIDYIWYTRLPYERDNIKFHREGEKNEIKN